MTGPSLDIKEEESGLANMHIMDEFLCTHKIINQVRARTLRGGMFVLSSQTIAHVIRMLSRIILARMIIPADFGMLAMVAAVTNFMLIFSDLGLGQVTVQRKQITHEQVSTLFWLNTGFGGIVSVIVMALAPVIVWFYQEPRLFWMVVVLATGFIFAGLTIQHQAILQRQLRMGAIAGINVFVALGSVAISLTALALGAGIWALVFGILSESIFKAVAFWFICRWRPGLPRLCKNVGSMLGFGSCLTTSSVLHYLASNLDHILIGKFYGAAMLGLYSRAYDLMLLPMRQLIMPVSPVAVSALSRIQNDPARYERYYLHGLWLVAMLVMPVMGFLMIMSAEVITFILGDSWAPSSPIFRILCVAAIIYALFATHGWLYTSLGRADKMLKMSIIWSVLTVGAFVAGLIYGPKGVAACYTLLNVVMIMPLFWYACRNTPVVLKNICITLFGPCIGVICMAVGLLAYKFMCSEFLGRGLLILTAFILSLILFLSAVCMQDGSLKPLKRLTGLLKELKNGGQV